MHNSLIHQHATAATQSSVQQNGHMVVFKNLFDAKSILLSIEKKHLQVASNSESSALRPCICCQSLYHLTTFTRTYCNHTIQKTSKTSLNIIYRAITYRCISFFNRQGSIDV